MSSENATYRLSGQSLEEPWEGSLDELFEANEDMPELVRRRIAQMRVGDLLRLDYKEDVFVVERVM
jgi:hypothetical protein